jgi:hypothetical protein
LSGVLLDFPLQRTLQDDHSPGAPLLVPKAKGIEGETAVLPVSAVKPVLQCKLRVSGLEKSFLKLSSGIVVVGMTELEPLLQRVRESFRWQTEEPGQRRGTDEPSGFKVDVKDAFAGNIQKLLPDGPVIHNSLNITIST